MATLPLPQAGECRSGRLVANADGRPRGDSYARDSLVQMGLVPRLAHGLTVAGPLAQLVMPG